MERFNGRHRTVTWFGALLILANPGWGFCAEADFGLAVGAEYTSGDYGGDQSVDDVYVPVTATSRSISRAR
jgi:hypothetical protein